MGKEPDEIRQEIEDTRARMGDTVEAIGYKADVKSRAKESISEKKDNIVSSVRNVKDSVVGAVAGTGSSVAGTVSDTAGSVRGSAGSTIDTVRGSTPSSEDVKYRARRAAGVAQQNPMGLALGSFAVGFLAGMVIPSTRVEEERIGPMASEAREKAMETGREALERGKQVAQETAQTARDAASEAAQKTMETAKETGQEHGQKLASSAQEKAQDMSGSSSMPAGGTGDLEDSGPQSTSSY